MDEQNERMANVEERLDEQNGRLARVEGRMEEQSGTLTEMRDALREVREGQRQLFLAFITAGTAVTIALLGVTVTMALRVG